MTKRVTILYNDVISYLEETILPEFEQFVESGAQYRKDATYVENIMNEFQTKTDALKGEAEEWEKTRKLQRICSRKQPSLQNCRKREEK